MNFICEKLSICFGFDVDRAHEIEEKVNDRIMYENQQTAKKDQQTIKLLLLGAGESGKSTLFKQMITIYGQGYSLEERLSFKPIIEQNTIMACKALVAASTEIQGKVDEDTTIAEELLPIRKELESLPLETIITDDIADKILKIWEDPGIQVCYANRNLFQFPDSGQYFIKKLKRISCEDYIPSQEDILRTRVRTTGIVETSFNIEGILFQMFDVGGQRTERKKWIHCFENVTCVIFVAAISEYDQFLYEDETTNRMVETLKLFDEICNSEWFVETSLILFLNKRDLFEEKIKRVPITDIFPDYTGDPHCSKENSLFIKKTFESLNRNSNKEIYTHITCATDTDNVQHVFESVKDTLIKNSLREGGFM